jgi:hypothetical protein
MSKYNTNINIEGKNIRNYFQNQISEKEPTLILKNKIKNIDSYSRVCQSNQRRQPVILTDDEYKKVTQQYPEYTNEEKHIKYGTNQNNKYHYICPKYWNMKTDLPITEDEMKENDLHKYIIPRNVNYVPKDKFIYEFTNKNGENHPYPNFITNRHPDGHCLPCCFKFGLDTTKHKKVKEKCTSGTDNSIVETNNKKPIDYIINSDKFPIDKDRKGFLPISLQKLLEQDNKLCQVSATNVSLKLGHDCLLRKGITYNSKQSFLECISDITNLGDRLEYLKDLMLSYLTLDKFTQIQNGNLINAFYDPTKFTYDPKMSDDYNKDTVKQYIVSYTNSSLHKLFKNSKLYKILNLNARSFDLANYSYNAMFFKKVCSSFINFTNYLMSPETNIDYTYTWDIITEMFSITLCIFEIHQIGDAPEILDVICPSNVYSKYKPHSKYDKIACIIKKDNLYEPIYLFNQSKNKTEPVITRLFSKKTPKVTALIKNLKRVITFINTYCGNINERIPNLQSSNKLLSVYELIHKMLLPKPNHAYILLRKVMNYSGKIIGLQVEIESSNFITKKRYTLTGVVTCLPTTIIDSVNMPNVTNAVQDLSNMPTTMVTDPSVWNTLRDTLKFYKDKHVLKIVQKLKNILLNGDYIVGFITESDQLIEISDKNIHVFQDPTDPLYNEYKDYEPYKGNYPLYESDQKISLIPHDNNTKNTMLKNTELLDEAEDTRINQYNHITQESAQYSFFRNIIKVRLPMNPEIYNEIYQIIIDNKASNNSKDIVKITNLLEELLKNKIKFTSSMPVNYIEVLLKTNMMDKSKIELLKYNENNKLYYSRIAGELLYNNRMRDYILNTSIHLALYKSTYDINPKNEIIITETMINDYYNKLESILEYPSKYNVYDMVDPYDAVDKYPIIDDSYSFHTSTHLVPETICDGILPKTNYEVPKYLKLYLKPESKLQIITFKKEYSYCNIVKLVQYYTQKSISILEIKQDLIRIYKQLITTLPNNNNNSSPRTMDNIKLIYKILQQQGKKELMEELKTDVNLSIINLIQDDHYWLTSLDYWLLLTDYNIPCLIQYKKTSDNAIWTMPLNRNKIKQQMPQSFSYIIGYGYNRTNRDTRQDGASFIIKENINFVLNISDFKPKYQDKLELLYDDQYKITNITEILHIFLNTKKIYTD